MPLFVVGCYRSAWGKSLQLHLSLKMEAGILLRNVSKRLATHIVSLSRIQYYCKQGNRKKNAVYWDVTP
jgi:hypothetical protein